MQKNQKIWIGLGVVLLVAVMIFLGLRNQGQKAGDGDVIKIGVILPLTGGAADIGEYSRQGLEMAVDEINRSGGVKGKKVVVFYEDSANESRKAMSAFQKLKDINNVHFFITSLSQSALPISEYQKNTSSDTLLFATIISKSGFADASHNIFRLCNTASHEGELLGCFLIKEKSLRNVCFYSSNDEYGKDTCNALQNSITRYGGNVLKHMTFVAGQTDHRSSLEQIKNCNPDVCVFVCNDQTAAQAMRQARQIGIQSQFAASAGAFGSPQSWEIAGDASENVFFSAISFELDDHNPQSKQSIFKKKYKERYHEGEQGIAGFAGFTCASLEVLVEAIKIAETENISSVAKALLTVSDASTSIGKITCNETNS